MREVAEITSETPKSRVPQKYKKTKKGRGLENCFPETLSKSTFTALQTADATYRLLSDPSSSLSMHPKCNLNDVSYSGCRLACSLILRIAF